MDKNDIKNLAIDFKDKPTEEILSHFLAFYAGRSKEEKDRIALASSLGAEDQVLTHMVLSINPAARIFILDTGRFHQETYSNIPPVLQ